MKLTEFSIRNPLAVAALALATALFGLYAYFTMGVGLVPNVNFPDVVVTTADPGADPATVDTQITKPIQDAVATLPTIDHITSTSSQGMSSVTVQFTTAANANLVAVDVERQVNSVRSKLPTTAEAPAITKIDTSAFPVITVALSGPQPLDQIEYVAENVVQRPFEAVPGVGSVTLSGGPTREIWVKADLTKLQAHGLGLNSLQQALQNEQIQSPAGSLPSAGKDASVVLNGLVSQPSQLGDIVVAQTSAGRVYVRDVATIDDTHATTTTINRVDGVPSVTITASKLADANSIKVSQGVRAAMAQLQPQLPLGMKMTVVADSAVYAQQSFNTIQRTLIEAVILTGLILLLFLHTWRSTLIVLIAIPTSVLTTFGLMRVLGLNLNLFSMLALTLAVGILVDDSIVVIENISRHLGLGQPPLLAAITGRSEIGLAAITITMVDVVVYVPIALISGIGGDFIRPFALVIAAATLTSLVVSFTLTPLLASRYLTVEEALKSGRGPLHAFGRWWDRGFDRLGVGYRALLHGALARRGMRWVVIAAGVASLALGLLLLRTGRIGIDIFPSGDQSEVDLTVVMPPATDISQTDAVVRQLEQRLQRYPEVREISSNTGGGSAFFGAAAGGDTSRLTVLLVPPAQRQRSSMEIANAFRQSLARGIVGPTLRIGLPNAFGFGGFGSQAIQVAVRGPNQDVLNRLVEQVTAAMRSVPGAVDVNNSNENVQPQYTITVDRNRAADLGVTAQSAATALAAAVDGIKVGEYQQPGQSNVDIRLIADDAFRASPANLAALPLLTSNGTIVTLGQVGTISQGTAPTQVQEYDREQSVTINASAGRGVSPGSLQAAIQQQVAQIPLPPGYSITYAGQAQQGAQAFSDIFRALAVAIVLMYVLMLLLFNSVTLPLAVLMSLPLAVVGALGAMTLTASNFTLFSLLGISLLLGLVGKNAILLVDYTDTLRKRGLPRTEALLEAGPTRLRPIVMTTLSVIAALAPVALGLEAGSELLKAAAIVLIGGLVTSTLLTLVFVPAMYTIFDDVQAGVVGLAHRVARPRELQPVELAIRHPEQAASADGARGWRPTVVGDPQLAEEQSKEHPHVTHRVSV